MSLLRWEVGIVDTKDQDDPLLKYSDSDGIDDIQEYKNEIDISGTSKNFTNMIAKHKEKLDNNIGASEVDIIIETWRNLYKRM